MDKKRGTGFYCKPSFAVSAMTNQNRIAAILIQLTIRFIRQRDRAEASPGLQLDLAVVGECLCC